MSLSKKLEKISEQFKASSPLASQAIEDFIRQLDKSDIVQYVLKEDDRIPDFSLEDIHGNLFSVKHLLEEKPAILTFYRGGWCPYCSIELQAWQAIYPELSAKGYEIVAISPEKAEAGSMQGSTMNLDFPTLSDLGNNVARLFGLVFKLSTQMTEILNHFGVDLVSLNGDDSQELPIPATYVVNTEGIIEKAYFDVDYRIRKDPEEILAIL